MALQNRIHQAVKFLNSVVPKGSPLQVLRNIRVVQQKDSLTMEATNLDSFLRIKLPIWGSVEGEYLVDAKAFLKLRDKVASKVSKEKVCFGKVTLANHDVVDFPSLVTDFFKHPIWEIPSANTKEVVGLGMKLCRYTAPPQEYRATLRGVCLRDGFLFATDGHRLLKCENSLKVKKGVECVFPPDFFKLLSNDFVLDDVIDISAYRSGTEKEQSVSLRAQGSSFDLVCKSVTDPYPDINTVLPKNFSVSFRADRRKFLGVIKEALNYANPKTGRVEISTPKSSSRFQIKAVDKDAGTEYADIVPVRNGNKKRWGGTTVNGKFLCTILEDCNGRNVEIKSNESPLSAIAVKSNDNHQLFLLMPLRKMEEPEPGQDKTEGQEQHHEAKKEEVAKV